MDTVAMPPFATFNPASQPLKRASSNEVSTLPTKKAKLDPEHMFAAQLLVEFSSVAGGDTPTPSPTPSPVPSDSIPEQPHAVPAFCCHPEYGYGAGASPRAVSPQGSTSDLTPHYMPTQQQQPKQWLGDSSRNMAMLAVPQPLPQLPPAASTAADTTGLDASSQAGAAIVREQQLPHAEKKPRMVWTDDIHRRFEEAVAQLGVKEATPLKIKLIMNLEGITTQHIKSHLQKYRLRLQNNKDGKTPSQQGSDGSTASATHSPSAEHTAYTHTPAAPSWEYMGLNEPSSRYQMQQDSQASLVRTHMPWHRHEHQMLQQVVV